VFAAWYASERTLSIPMDAIEETLRDGDFHEIILSTLPHGVSRSLHVDVPHRVAHLGLPLATVVAREQGRRAGHWGRSPRPAATKRIVVGRQARVR
jgi:hypothetical protein